MQTGNLLRIERIEGRETTADDKQLENELEEVNHEQDM